MGPLSGVRVVELAGIGPGPFGVMLLADMGADVVRVDRVDRVDPGGLDLAGAHDVLSRGRRSVAVNLKDPRAAEVVLRLADDADVLVEGFRPGVTERLGVGPDRCLARNPALVYARTTGWGQEGPWAARAGHDLNFLALSGALHPIGPGDGPPVPPLNYVADFGGGGVLLAFGVVCALWERGRSGRGQVVDAAMIDGAAAMTAMLHGLLASGGWEEARGSNLLDGAAPFYRTYACADGRFVAVAALESRFHDALLDGLGLDPADWPQHDRSRWPGQAQALAAVFATRTRDEWAAHFEGTDACVTPVLSPLEAPDHPHVSARATFVRRDGVARPAPAPRFSRSGTAPVGPTVSPGADTDEVLGQAGFSTEEIAALRAAGAVR